MFFYLYLIWIYVYFGRAQVHFLKKLITPQYTLVVLLRNDLEITWATGAGFYSYSRRNNRRLASYVTIVTTPKTDKKTSELPKLFRDRS